MSARGRREIVRYLLRLGVVGFGGPNAHIAMVHEELVRRRGWLPDREFLSVLGVTNLIPGPNSSELAIQLGYLRGGVLGGVLAGLAFLLPAFLMVVALSWAYVEFGPAPARDEALVGIQPVALAAILIALWRLRSAVRGGVLAPALAGAGFGLTLAFPRFAPAILVAGGVAGLATRTSRADRALAMTPAFLAAGLVVAANVTGLPALAWVFLRTGLFLFGGGLVLVPLLQGEVVARGWLSRSGFPDGVAIGQSPPGPIVMTAAS